MMVANSELEASTSKLSLSSEGSLGGGNKGGSGNRKKKVKKIVFNEENVNVLRDLYDVQLELDDEEEEESSEEDVDTDEE